MSKVRESNPWWAMTSAENALGIDSHPFTTAAPRAQIVLSVFSLTSPSSRSGAELGAADRAEVAPATNPKVLGLLEVGDGRDVRRRIREIGLHRPDREAELLANRLEPLVAPVDPRHLGLAQVRLEEVHARRLDAEDIVSVARGAAELEGRAVWGGDRKSTRLNSSHITISYAVFCLKKKKIALHEHAAFTECCALHTLAGRHRVGRLVR